MGHAAFCTSVIILSGDTFRGDRHSLVDGEDEFRRPFVVAILSFCVTLVVTAKTIVR